MSKAMSISYNEHKPKHYVSCILNVKSISEYKPKIFVRLSLFQRFLKYLRLLTYEIKCDISCYAFKHIVILIKQYNYKYN